jgi:hypothetical protein
MHAALRASSAVGIVQGCVLQGCEPRFRQQAECVNAREEAPAICPAAALLYCAGLGTTRAVYCM